MAKQPYIPLYTGDYLKDTRRLPLEVRGAWVDIMIFMWENKERGVISGTMPEFAQMMSCTLEQANFVIGLLQQKNVCDFEIEKNGHVKLISRRMVRDAEISKKRAGAGKKGMENRYNEICYNKTDNKPPNKSVTNSDIDNDIDNSIKEGVQGKPNIERFNPDDFFQTPIKAFEELRDDELFVEQLIRVVHGNGFRSCTPVNVIKAVKKFITLEGAKEEFSVKPKREVKRHLVNWINKNASKIHEY
jgi:uncharacterized protein YdaU (DUF1376 family)